jgi:hypothetical protein
MAANMKPAVFWSTVQYSLENVYKTSDEPLASINRVDNYPSGSSAMLLHIYQISWLRISEDSHFQSHTHYTRILLTSKKKS